MQWCRHLLGLGLAVAVVEGLLIRGGRTYGSNRGERTLPLPGDGIVPSPDVVTDHAVTIASPVDAVWPWLVQLGWGRGGWYTARWVDRLLFPANGPSSWRVVPHLQHLEVGDFVPDGPPETKCGFIVEALEPERTLVLHSTSHLPLAWRRTARARLDWSWAFVLRPCADDRMTRLHFRSRWVASPWWVTVASRLLVVPADLLMARDMLRGVAVRAERLAHSEDRSV